MAYAYKLLSQEMTSRHNTKWETGKAIEISKEFSGNELCSNQLLHCYASPEIAVFMNTAHANIPEPRLFRIRCSKILADDGTKQGFACDPLAKLNNLLQIPVIASGGAGAAHHFLEAFTVGKADAALAASLFHFGELKLAFSGFYFGGKRFPQIC